MKWVIGLLLVMLNVAVYAKKADMQKVKEPPWTLNTKFNYVVNVKSASGFQDFYLKDNKNYDTLISLGEIGCKLVLVGEEDFDKENTAFSAINEFLLYCRNSTTKKSLSMLGSFEKQTVMKLDDIELTIELINYH